MLRLFADSFSAEPTEGKGRACSELIVTMCWSALLTSFHTEKRGFSQKTCQVTAPLSQVRELPFVETSLEVLLCMKRLFFWGLSLTRPEYCNCSAEPLRFLWHPQRQSCWFERSWGQISHWHHFPGCDRKSRCLYCSGVLCSQNTQ